VFDFFNYPRLAIGQETLIKDGTLADSLPPSTNNKYPGANFVMPDPETDWLFEATSS
jgi:hypothetical protein